MKYLYFVILISFIAFSAGAQKLVLVPENEIDVPTDHPWGLTYHDDYFWISDSENGNIVKLHRYEESLTIIKAPRNHITGLTFEGDWLWVLSDEWDTIAFPYLCSQKALLFKLNPETGDVLDTLLVPYYHYTIPADPIIQVNREIPKFAERFLLGLSYYDSSLFVSFYGGWGPCLYRVESDNRITELCCPHPSGLETINGELWAIGDAPWEVIYADPDSAYINVTDTGSVTVQYPIPVFANAIFPVIMNDSFAYEDRDRQLEFNFYASDLAHDGTNFWLCDPVEKKIKRMVVDTIKPDTIPYCFSIDKLEILPENPTPEDEIKVICHSTFTSGGCDMVDYDLSIGKTGIYIEAYHEVGMLTYICHSSDTINIGKLPGGHHYMLQYSLTAINLNCGSVQDYIEIYVRDTTTYPVYLEIIPEQPVAGEEVKIVTHGICYLNSFFDLVDRHITLYAFYGSCIMAPCGIDTISLGFLSPDAYSLDYYLVDICIPSPGDSIVYYENILFDVKGALTVEDKSESNIFVYPNPASDRLFIQTTADIRELYAELYNVSGQRIMKRNFSNTNSIDLDISDLPKGIYFLKLSWNRDTRTEKIIIN